MTATKRKPTKRSVPRPYFDEMNSQSAEWHARLAEFLGDDPSPNAVMKRLVQAAQREPAGPRRDTLADAIEALLGLKELCAREFALERWEEALRSLEVVISSANLRLREVRWEMQREFHLHATAPARKQHNERVRAAYADRLNFLERLASLSSEVEAEKRRVPPKNPKRRPKSLIVERIAPILVGAFSHREIARLVLGSEKQETVKAIAQRLRRHRRRPVSRAAKAFAQALSAVQRHGG